MDACEGEELLEQVAVALYALLQQGGLLARFGGQLHIVEPLCLEGKGRSWGCAIHVRHRR